MNECQASSRAQVGLRCNPQDSWAGSHASYFKPSTGLRWQLLCSFFTHAWGGLGAVSDTHPITLGSPQPIHMVAIKDEVVRRHYAASQPPILHTLPSSPPPPQPRVSPKTHLLLGYSTPAGLALTCGKICSWGQSHTGLQREDKSYSSLWKGSHCGLRTPKEGSPEF